MNLSCIICSDLFVPTSDIYSTPCGHIFHYHCLIHWLDNSKTCPQCRTKTTTNSLLRLYINVTSSDNSEDATVLQHKLDGVEFQMRLKDKDISNLQAKKKELNKQNVALRSEIKRLELEEVTHQSAIAALKDQIKFFKTKSQNCDSLIEQVSQLKNKLKDLEHVQAAVTASRSYVDDIIRNENSMESLALLAATLKKSLVETDRKKRQLQFQVKQIQTDFTRYKKDMEEKKCEYESLKRELEALKLNYEREVNFLKNKFTQLEEKMSRNNLNDSVNTSIRRIVSESPVNCHRTPPVPVTEPKDRDIREVSFISSHPEQKSSRTIRHVELVNPPNDSPLPARSLAPFGVQRTKPLVPNSHENKFSIFKNKSTSQLEPLQMERKLNDCMCYNGLGSSSKEDIFPSPRKISSGFKRTKTNKLPSSTKLRKLSADAGKLNKKMSDYF
ncbi:E3 ubiquitin-protein ligase TRAIP [Sitophilus oryzae]|uniref:E3 ubiquitin-protein ligase TRAIP n=1 Tax=Sitophilus oryzae TaxID=7048 RepID=A0A6J2YG53_SITOR|nr:E3 ubiquitin-protein ligase TRAIP [Sitophilus oryzae]